jgi:hypothetical protein
MLPMRLTKRELRQRSLELNALMCDWDPIGVMADSSWPRDEYECLVGPLLTLLQSDATKAGIGDYLRKEVAEHFGLPADRYDFLAIAARVHSWFDLGWRDAGEVVTVFVALLGEGVDVWRPVQARPLGGGLFRIVGVDADVSDESWQFPVGAIVTCARKQFANGQIGMTAVGRVERTG